MYFGLNDQFEVVHIDPIDGAQPLPIPFGASILPAMRRIAAFLLLFCACSDPASAPPGEAHDQPPSFSGAPAVARRG
jgi:hypothetical protein